MTLHLSTRQVQHAVKQLARSSAKTRVCEFLIGVRTLRLSGGTQVGVAESVTHYIQALNEVSRWSDSEATPNPYFNPFGNAAGYKSRRFPSNGPSNTMHGWATQPDAPFNILPTRPKSIERRPVTVAQLRNFFLIRSGAADRPRLIDAAVWFYRSTDLDGTEGGPDRTTLEDMFVGALGLTADEVTALFRREADDTDDDAMPPTEEPAADLAQGTPESDTTPAPGAEEVDADA